MQKIKAEEAKMMKIKLSYGNTCRPTYPGVKELTKEQEKHAYTWSAFVETGLGRAESEKLIKSITFKLHPTFKNPIRTVSKFPFQITTNGWGMFDLPITINWQPELNVLPLKLNFCISFEDEGVTHSYIAKIPKVVSSGAHSTIPKRMKVTKTK